MHSRMKNTMKDTRGTTHNDREGETARRENKKDRDG